MKKPNIFQKITDGIFKGKLKNFSALDKAIQRGKNEIILSNDISLNEGEENDYAGGIVIDVDNLVIDGNGHAIDACGKARIFHCTGKNIKIKNITLKHGSAVDGGAIFNEGVLSITDSQFHENSAENDGGAIANTGELAIEKTTFANNRSLGENDGGGAIANTGMLSVTKSSLTQNTAQGHSGAICNVGELTLIETTISDNRAALAGAMFSEGLLTIIESEFCQNTAENTGGVHNSGELTIRQSSFIQNTSQGRAGALFNDYSQITLSSNTFNENSARNGGSIYNEEGTIILKDTTFQNNSASWNGGAIHSSGELIIQDGELSNNDAKASGGAVYSGKSLTVHNSILNDNHASSTGGAIYNDEYAEIKDSILKGNSAGHYGGAIHSHDGKLLKVNNSTFEDNTAEQGGAISSYESELIMADVKMNCNTADKYGGAISISDGSAGIECCEFVKNSANRYNGGAIYSTYADMTLHEVMIQENASNDSGGGVYISGGNVTVNDATFQKNTTEDDGGAIHSGSNSKLMMKNVIVQENRAGNNGGAIDNDAELTINEVTIKKNAAKNGGAIHNKNGTLEICNVTINENTAEDGGAIHNAKGTLDLSESKLTDNLVTEYGGAITNHGNALVKNVLFEGNDSRKGCSQDIYNDGELKIVEPQFRNGEKTIFNKRDIMLPEETIEKMHEGCSFKSYTLLDEGQKGFKYLNDLIRSGGNEIRLGCDIKLDVLKDENKDFPDGIDIGAEGLTIEGNGHAIDAQKFTRIFNVTGSGITIRNAVLKNGCSLKDGGAIRNEGELIIMDSKLLENAAYNEGGSIYNQEGTLTIINTLISGSSARKGGAISSTWGEIRINDSQINANTAQNDGGAIYGMFGSLTINGTEFTNDTANHDGGAIFSSFKDLTIHDCMLKENTSKENGGCICNSGIALTIFDTILEENTSQYGGAISNNGKLTIKNAKFQKNAAEYGGAIKNKTTLILHDAIFADNDSNEFSQDIFNEGKLNILSNPDFTSNAKTIHNKGHVMLFETNGKLVDRIYDEKMIIFPLKENERDFTYLHQLVHSGTNKIELEYDIRLDLSKDEEKEFVDGIELAGDDLVIDGRGHTIDAQKLARIFNVSGKNITIRNIALKNGFSRNGNGGAVYNKGELSIQGSKLTNSYAGNYGGAIYNDMNTILEINDVALYENTAGEYGGAIHNHGKMTIRDCVLHKNSAEDFGAIHNWAKLSIADSILGENAAKKDGGAIGNLGGLSIENVTLQENKAGCDGGAISSSGDISMANVTLLENEAGNKGGAIINSGEMTIRDSTFENNDSNECSQDIFNEKILTLLSNLDFSAKTKTIENESEIKLSDESKKLQEKICNNGNIYSMGEDEKSFAYLDECIHGDYNEIKLEHDIKLDVFNKEEEMFLEGIVIDSDDIVFDGCGHTIDAQHKTRIFFVKGKNVTIKNVVLKNGCEPEEYGGAIHNIGELTVEDATLKANMANKNGGAINNKGKLTLKRATLKDNAAENNGGAINNYGGSIKILDTAIIKSNSKDGAGIYNYDNGTITIENTSLDGNAAENNGGAINNSHGTVEMKNTAGNDNVAENGGGIYNRRGTMMLDRASFNTNAAKTGGAINNSKGTLRMENSSLNENTASCGGAIENDGEFTIRNTTLVKNTADNDGGAIRTKFQALTIENSSFEENAAENGGAIYNDNVAKTTIEDTSLHKNTAKGTGGAIFNNSGIIRVKNTSFDQNDSSQEFTQDIYNKKDLVMVDVQFKSDDATILNLETVNVNEDIEWKMHNSGNVIYMQLPDENQRNFKYVDQLIHGDSNEIKLEHDIMLDFTNFEDDKYPNGIPVDVDDVVIDGNCHVIDALDETRIFNISARNVTIKNFILKNGNAMEGGAILNEGELTLQRSILTENVARFAGGAIINKEEGTINIRNCHIHKNKASKEGVKATNSGVDGGAIKNEGTAEIYNSRIECNHAICSEFPTLSRGGAIYNCPDADLTMMNTVLDNNASMIEGEKFNRHIQAGAIFNLGKVLMNRCEITNNRSGSSIIVNQSQMNIFNSTIEGNYFVGEDGYDAHGILIENHSVSFNNPGNLNMENTEITNHDAQIVLANSAMGILSLSGGKIIDNMGKTTILTAGESSISATKFYNNQYQKSRIIQNKGKLILKNPHVNDDSYTSILNNGKIIISHPDLRKLIDNEGTIRNGFYQDGNNDFTNLNDLIHAGNKEIVLDNDYAFEEYEMEFFEGGIVLDIDDLVIDGQNHVIDARNMSRIFLVTAKNVTLKNLKLKNGQSFLKRENPINSDGGAVRINEKASLLMESCSFENNTSKRNGGSIINSGKLHMQTIDIKENRAVSGGAISNWGKLTMEDAIISQNRSEQKGGSILNHGEMVMSRAVMNENSIAKDSEIEEIFGYPVVNLYGGAICNCLDGDLKICESTLSDNSVYNEVEDDDRISCNGGAISNFGKIEMDSSELENNKTRVSTSKRLTYVKNGISNGGAIYNCGEITIKDSSFSKNDSRKGGAVDNETDATLTIINTRMENHRAGNGGAVFNDGKVQIKGSFFTGNVASIASGIYPYGGAIRNENLMCMENCTFKNNNAYYGGAIHNMGTLQVESSNMEENEAKRLGGAIYSDDGELHLRNSTFVKNDAGEGNSEIRVIDEKKYKQDSEKFLREMNDYEKRLRSMKSRFPDGSYYIEKLQYEYESKFFELIHIWGGAVWAIDEAHASIKGCEFEGNVPNDTYFKT